MLISDLILKFPMDYIL